MLMITSWCPVDKSSLVWIKAWRLRSHAFIFTSDNLFADAPFVWLKGQRVKAPVYWCGFTAVITITIVYFYQVPLNCSVTQNDLKIANICNTKLWLYIVTKMILIALCNLSSASGYFVGLQPARPTVGRTFNQWKLLVGCIKGMLTVIQ